MFHPVENNVDFPAQELATGKFWKEHSVYEKSLERRLDAPPFVFYEGPPTANGKPHPGHCLTRTIKDVFPRYRTMRGYRCKRKAGWDTHGLPVEVEVCKELGIHSKEEIENYGVEPFIHKCEQSVWRYIQDWQALTERIGFWVDLEDAYVTYHQTYVEGVWWSLKNLFDRDLLYQGHKIVWWWSQGGTALSAGEVGQGYREVSDPSVFVRFPLVDQHGSDTNTSLLVWTTTPWTLLSNQFAAVHPDLEYATVIDRGPPPPTEAESEPLPSAILKNGEKLIIAADLVETIASKAQRELVIESTCRGTDLIGRRYRPPFEHYYRSQGNQLGTLKDGSQEVVGWRVLAADFVTTDSGSGIVHQAPAFGEVDYEVFQTEQARFLEQQGPELICAVGPDGRFTAEVPDYQGRWVKEADKDIIRDLKQRGSLYHREQYLHDYPFCWRAEQDPLIQYPRKSWFIRTTAFKDAMLANNQKIAWLPQHIQNGRFGKFLESNVDWALSRERYWGTPLPIWVCDETGKKEAVASYDELLSKPGVTGTEVWEQAKAANPDLSDDLKVHKPYIDAITYESPYAAGTRMRRVPEVIDCWYDSGAMPFAQWGYRGQTDGPSREQFDSQFPADFISEAIDQTRGWFYSQLAISTLLFGAKPGDGNNQANLPSQPVASYPHPFRNCIVLGLMLSEWWESKDGKQLFLTEQEALDALGPKNSRRCVGKMSKSKRNYREPAEIFDRYGADTLRWYFLANQPPWTSIRYSEQAIKDSIPEFLLRLWNVYSFFVIYANIDGFDPGEAVTGEVDQLTATQLATAATYHPAKDRSELDRWILSELNQTIATVIGEMDQYDNFNACRRITEFLDALSNWYVRRSRNRFWAKEKQADAKLDAYWTLYECLIATSKLIAPFVPFVAETIWQNLASVYNGRAAESVHLCDYPEPTLDAIDESLSAQMHLLREITSLGRNARSAASLKVRQPLAKVEVILANSTHQAWLEQHVDLIAEELNVKVVQFAANADRYISYSVVPNFKRLGPRLGKNMPAVKKLLSSADGGVLLEELKSTGKVQVNLPDGTTFELDEEDIEVRLQAKEGWAAAQGQGVVVVLATELSPELISEGLAREVVRAIQEARKEQNCDFTDRIHVGIVTESEELRSAIEGSLTYIQNETLAERILFEPLAQGTSRKVTVAKHEMTVFIEVVP